MREPTTVAEVHIHLRARTQDRMLIDQAAERVGTSRSQFMLASALTEAKNILRHRETMPAESKPKLAVITAPRNATEAEAQLRQVVAQMTAARKPSPMIAHRHCRSKRPMNAAEAELQIRTVVEPFVEAIVRWGELPSIVGTVVDDGLTWNQRIANRPDDLDEDPEDATS